MAKIRLFLFSILIISFCAKSQEDATYVNFIDAIRNYELKKAEVELSNFPEGTKTVLQWQINFLRDFMIDDPSFQSLENLKLPENSDIGEIYYYLNQGDYQFNQFSDKNVIALETYKTALDLALKAKSKPLVCEVLKKILALHRLAYLYNNDSYKTYLALYKTYKYDALENAYYNYFNLILNFKNEYLDRWDKQSFSELQRFVSQNEVPYLKGIAYTVYGSYYEELEERDSIYFYVEKGIEEFLKIPENYKGSRLNQLYIYKARTLLRDTTLNNRERVERAREAISKATEKVYNSSDYKRTALRFYYNAIVDTLEGDYKTALKNMLAYNLSQDTIRENRYASELNELEVKYQTAEKEKQLLIEKEEKTQNRNIAIALGGGLLSVLLLSVLLYKNSKKKQRIAEQQRTLEIQSKEKILKEQELNTINAMIEGQEKEREYLASELHDSVGATLSAAKLQFDHLSANRSRINEMDELIEKTKTLLDEAYTEVRGMAHAKNSGVIANQGLLPAIKRLAKNASGTNGLEITVEDYGLIHRLENSLEITIFRIIQELVTNIIKHANASEASISITQHEDSLNIIIEDNGQGFDARYLQQKDGMGLASIEKRIEHLEGTMEIDSNKHHGTTILIDLPV